MLRVIKHDPPIVWELAAQSVPAAALVSTGLHVWSSPLGEILPIAALAAQTAMGLGVQNIRAIKKRRSGYQKLIQILIGVTFPA